jgi:hypothetical protein
MSKRIQKYNQLVDSQGKEELDKYSVGLLKRLWFKINKTYKYPIYWGMSAWRNRSDSSTYTTSGYTTIPFTTQEHKSQQINIWKTSDHKFRVGKSGFYEFNVNWCTGIAAPATTRCLSISLYLVKNGASPGTDNHINLDNKEMMGNCIGVGGCYIWFGLSHLMGTKILWLDKDIDFVEFQLYHASDYDLTTGDSHHGFCEIKYLGNKGRSLL